MDCVAVSRQRGNVYLPSGTVTFEIEADSFDESRVVVQFVIQITRKSRGVTCVTTVTPKNVVKPHGSRCINKLASR